MNGAWKGMKGCVLYMIEVDRLFLSEIWLVWHDETRAQEEVKQVPYLSISSNLSITGIMSLNRAVL